jgi:formate C-acetyltransferase
MLVMADENYPGPGVSFGRIDQYLYPFWRRSLETGMDREWGKELLKCFWVHCNTAYDGMIRTGGNQGITAGYGQLITLSGMGAGSRDLTNDLTYAFWRSYRASHGPGGAQRPTPAADEPGDLCGGADEVSARPGE